MKSTGMNGPTGDRGSFVSSQPVRCWNGFERGLVALGCILTLALNPMMPLAADASNPAATAATAPAAATGTSGAAAASGAAGTPGASGEAAKEEPKLTNDQLDSLVAPVALYPDDLLAQTLVASTYPLELIQLYQWLAKEENKKLKD